MSHLLQSFRESLRTNFGSTVALIIVGIIAFIFVGYLTIDYIRTALESSRRKKRYRDEDDT